MNRRTLLKGAVAAAVIDGAGLARPDSGRAARRVRLIAQAPVQYELVDLWPHFESVSEGGQQVMGTVRSIANDGTCVGDEVMDGVLRAVCWDLSGAMSLLDMRVDPMVSTMATLANSTGTVVGTTRPTGGLSDDSRTGWTNVMWRNGSEVTAGLPDAFGDAGTIVTSIDDGAVMAGEVARTPSRWVDGTLAQIPAQPGFIWGGARAIAPSGAVGGTLWTSQDFSGLPAPFTWAPDGSVTMFDSPMGFAQGASSRFRVFTLDDGGGLVASCSQGGIQPDYLLRYSSGMQTPIPDITGEGGLLMAANATGTLLGYCVVNGAYIPSIWVNDQPQMLADLIAPGPDRLLTEVTDINDDGLIVGKAQDSMGMIYSVVLMPV